MFKIINISFSLSLPLLRLVVDSLHQLSISKQKRHTNTHSNTTLSDFWRTRLLLEGGVV